MHGSSKSTCAVVIQNILRTGLNPLIIAKTNKAIVGMNNAKTIARFLQENVGLSVTKDTWEERRLKAFQKKDTVDFVIVDESSQVGELDRIILQTVCKKVLYMGDQNQCKPIHDRQAVNTVYIHSLKEQYRFLNAEQISNNLPYQKLFTLFYKEKRKKKLADIFNDLVIGEITTKGFYEQDKNDYVLKNDYSSSFENHIDTLKKYADDDSIIIAFSQNAVDTINSILNEGGALKVGSKVSLKQNDYLNDQFNGYQYRIKQVLNNGKCVCTSIENEETYVFNNNWLALSYAITTMSAQGSSWKHVLGIDKTSPASELWTDRYVITTRAATSIHFLTSLGIGNKDVINLPEVFSTTKDVLSFYQNNAKEGNRNNLLYGCLLELDSLQSSDQSYSTLYNLAIESGLTEDEIKPMFDNHKNHKLKLLELDLNKNVRNTLYYTPVFNSGKTLAGSARICTLEEALAFKYIKHVAEELKDSNRIVIDCDSERTVALFEQYLDKTESYISENKDSAHLVFTTNRLVPTKHKREIDLLGNSKYSLRNIKANKKYNGVQAIPLTQEILDIFNEL